MVAPELGAKTKTPGAGASAPAQVPAGSGVSLREAVLAASLVAQDLLTYLYEKGIEPLSHVPIAVRNIVQLAYAVAFRGLEIEELHVKVLLDWIRTLEEWLRESNGVNSIVRDRLLLHFKCVEEMIARMERR